MMADLPRAEPWVSDEVWSCLDPHAGQPSWQAVRRFMAVTVMLAILVVAGAALWAYALSSPRVGVGGSGIGSRIGSQRLKANFDLTNDSSRTARIAALTGSSNLAVISVTGLPKRLAAHASVPITVRVRITNCVAARRSPGSLYLQVARRFGHTSERLDLPIADMIGTACKGH